MRRSLSDTQAGFVQALRDPAHPVPDRLGTRDGRPAKRRFDVHRNNVVVGMIEALRATFPAVERLVGEDFFNAAARAYLEKEPPGSPLLFRYGKTFGAFLDGFPPAATVPYLCDVARLEWARLEAYHAADRDPLSIDALSGVPAHAVGETTFELHPSLRLIASAWPVVSLWAASTDRGSSADVDMKRPEAALVIRPALEVDTRLLPICGYQFMMVLKEGATLEAAAVAAAERADGFDLASHLQGLFEMGAVTAIGQENQGTKDKV
jgi:hypothetical protein